MSDQVKKWYVVKVISGKEAKIQKLIENEIQRNHLEDYVGDILVPTEKVVQIRNGKRIQKDKTLFPGYIYIEANLSGELPHVIKSIPGVMGFLSGVKGGDPMPLSKKEVNRILGKLDELAMNEDTIMIPYKVGEAVTVTDGPFKGFEGVIEDVNKDRKKVTVMVKFFGRKTPLELGYFEVKKIPSLYDREFLSNGLLIDLWLITINYREAYGMFASNGILFNHESPLRGETFVSRKITRAAAKIVLGLQEKLYLGNLEAQRDWGHAKDYVRMMWLILQHDKPDDWVIATGITTSVRNFVCKVFENLGIEIGFEGEGAEEVGIIKKCHHPDFQLKEGKIIIEVDKRYFRPTEVDQLVGDFTKARKKLGWTPEYSLDDLIKEMTLSDLELMRKEKLLKDNGFTIPRNFE